MAEENSGIQYEPDVPTVPEDESSNIPKKHSGGSNADEDDAEASGSNAPGAGSGGGDSSAGGTGTGQGNQATGGGGDKAANGSKPAGGDVGKAQSLQTVSSPATESSDDGSSPLVPVLIAVAVLAAISIGAYYYRQRRQDTGSPVSPNAS